MNASDRSTTPREDTPHSSSTAKSGGTVSGKGLSQPRSQSDNLLVSLFKCLASLKLTVGLLILSVFVIWVATLQQIEMDIWEVKKRHFPSLFVYIPFYTYFPPAWMPDWRAYLEGWKIAWLGREVSIGLPIPSGFFVILAMLVNLLSAHALRFRIQTSGAKRMTGVAVTLVGILVCAGVVFLGQSDGLQNRPPVQYSTMWNVTLAAMFAAGLGAAGFCYWLESHRTVEKILSGTLAVALCAAPLVIWYTGASIGDSGMRILWQIAQCSAATIVLLGGLMLLFRRKAGIVLLHAGLILLLGNEIWVTLTHLEQRLSGVEGETVAHTIDIRETELVLVNRQGDQDQIYTVPAQWLQRSASRSEEEPERWIAIPNTDLEVRCLEYYPNSDIGMARGDNPATEGLGRELVVNPMPVVSGVSGSDEMDTASAYVQFRNRDGDDLGTFLASQFQRSTAPIFARPNVVTNGDRQYALRLWYRHFYKPYEVTIESIESMDYPGTTIPRWYSTEFKIVDHETGYRGTQKVWMNNPLRYRNETFYQSGYFKDPVTGQESTTLQVVRNRGWMIPYLCCAMVSIGLLAQFVPMMLTYIEKRQRLALQADQVEANAEQSEGSVVVGDSLMDQKSGDRRGWLAPVIAASLAGVLFVGWAYPKTPKHAELNLSKLGAMPISYKGRIQPLDSLARTNLRKTIGLESARTAELTVFGTEKKYPAIAWLADSIFTREESSKYRVFRVVNPTLLQNLHLSARSGFRYTTDELNASLDVLRDLDSEARKKEKNQRSEVDKSALDLARKLAETQTIVNALGGPSSFVRTQTEDRPIRLYEEIVSAAASKSAVEVPGVVPATEPMAPWLTLDEAEARLKLEGLADQHGTDDTTELFMHVVNHSIAEAMLEDEAIRNEMQDVLEGKTPEEQQAVLASRLEGLSIDQVTMFINRILKFDERRFMSTVLSAVQKLVGEEQINRLTDTQKETTRIWRDVRQAYLTGNQEALDESVEAFETALRSDESTQIPWGKVKTEYRLSAWSPFYVASVMSLFVCIVSIPSLLGSIQLRRFAFLIQCLVLVLITAGLIARIYISGRAPVTSIYSSALAIGWGCVLGFLLLEAATRLGIANVLGGFSGYAILLTAYGLSLNDDKFSVLRAVLDTQFWLWTHVTCVALGYVLTLIAGLWSLVILISAAMRDRETVKRSADLTYGLICAATILSFVGTVLGGLWADDSWGRFWGWDPKENGAAMIVLWNASVLHARWAGLIRYRGLMVMALIGNIITLWSWFAVNELGIGLHSYGFTEGVIFYLTVAWGLHLVAIATAFLPLKHLSRSAAA